MEGNTEAAKAREHNYKEFLRLRFTWLDRNWRISRNGNSVLKYQGKRITVFPSQFDDGYRVCVGGVFEQKTYNTEDEAKMAAFDAISDSHTRALERTKQAMQKEKPPRNYLGG
jgi:hypothetical protein